jgi:hypothetical protein
MVSMQKRQEGAEEPKDANRQKNAIRGMFREIDDGQIRADEHYRELIKLQRKSAYAIGTDGYEGMKKALMAKEAQFYNDLADQHERFAASARISSYVNGGLAGLDAGVVAVYAALGGNVIVEAIAGAVSVFAAVVAMLAVKLKRNNERIAAERREKAKSLENGDAY